VPIFARAYVPNVILEISIIAIQSLCKLWQGHSLGGIANEVNHIGRPGWRHRLFSGSVYIAVIPVFSPKVVVHVFSLKSWVVTPKWPALGCVESKECVSCEVCHCDEAA
jgi:hypothetical protein